MTDETATDALVGAGTEPVSEAPEATAHAAADDAPEAVTDDQQDAAPETADEAPADDLADADEQPAPRSIDFWGSALDLPADIPEEIAAKIEADLKGAQAKYTKGTQELADQRKAADARLEALRVQEEVMTGEASAQFARAHTLVAELQQLNGINLPALWQSQPDQARRVSDTISAKKAELEQAVVAVSAAESKVRTAQAQERDRQIEEGKAAAEKLHKGISEQMPEIVAYVSERYGMDAEVAGRDWPLNPAFADMARKAMMFDRMQSKAQAAKASKQPAAPVKPIKGKGAATAQRDPDKLSTDEWMRQRGAQLRKRA